jgi:hypothetical protein
MADNLICGRGVDKNRLAEVLRKEFKNPVGSFFQNLAKISIVGTTARGSIIF